MYTHAMALLATVVFTCVALLGSAQNRNIQNNRFWNTVDGQPIYSQGGGIFQFKNPETGIDTYYWYGAFYKEAELYRNDPSKTQPVDNFVAVTCYSSLDLVNWKFEGNVLDRAEVNKHADSTRWMGRLGVAFVKELNRYALFIQHNDGVLIALSESPTAPFKWHRRLDMTDRIGTPNTGDQTLFTDPDTGTSYLVYSYGRGRHKIYISEIGVKDEQVDLLDCTQIFRGLGREGNCMVKHNGKYYVLASNLYGWDSSYAYYLVADSVKGPYTPTDHMLIIPGSMDDYAHVTQTGFLVNVKGSKHETVLYCGDRWANFAGNGLGYNQWVPLSFEGDVPYFNSLHSWNFDAQTGAWSVADDNNYVRNGSFEADRKYIPSSVKPIQEQLKGWHSKVIQGNEIGVGVPKSPVLNYYNTTHDRTFVVGEKSLNISDSIDFKRKVFQTIESTPYVPLPDGTYTLTAKVKCGAGFRNMEMYAECKGEKLSVKIADTRQNWTSIELKNVRVTGGKVEVGFWADGTANAQCLVDDVTFVKDRK